MTEMKRFVCLPAGLALCMFLFLPSTASADFLNPGFEIEELGGPATNAADWNEFAGSTSTGERDDTMPRTGDWDLLLQTDGDTSGFAGAYQAFPVSPGQSLIFSAWGKVDELADGTAGIDDDGDPNTQMRMRFEWRSGGSGSGDPNTQINLMSTINGSYQKFTVSDIVPVGVDEVRAVIVLNRNDDAFYFDDASFTIVPEPATLGLALFASVGLLCGRRRS